MFLVENVGQCSQERGMALSTYLLEIKKISDRFVNSFRLLIHPIYVLEMDFDGFLLISKTSFDLMLSLTLFVINIKNGIFLSLLN